MKPALSPQITGSCRSERASVGDVVENVGLGDHGADDLDELLHRRRVEEVQADDPAGMGVAVEISVTDSEEVLVARIASGATMRVEGCGRAAA